MGAVTHVMDRGGEAPLRSGGKALQTVPRQHPAKAEQARPGDDGRLRNRMIRVLLVDDHPALRAGLEAVLRVEPGLVPVGAAAGEHDLWPQLRRTQPDIVLMDYHLPGTDGLLLCHRVKAMLLPPHVVIYTAYADAALALPARLAGADAIVSKGAPATELYDVLRRVARGDELLPAVPRELIDAVTGRLDPADLPILGMLLDRTPNAEIAETLGTDAESIGARIERMLQGMRIRVPVPGGSDPLADADGPAVATDASAA